jgi:glycine cleavage system H protein
MSTPEHLRYSVTHQWARRESDGLVSVGITDHAQEQLGDVVFVQNPAPGSLVKQGEACGVVESVKAASDVYSPVSGEVVAVNEVLSDAPEQVNDDPYVAWMFRIRPENAAEMDNLLDAQAYQKVAEAEKN